MMRPRPKRIEHEPEFKITENKIDSRLIFHLVELNKIPGVKTFFSCSGHSWDELSEWMRWLLRRFHKNFHAHAWHGYIAISLLPKKLGLFLENINILINNRYIYKRGTYKDSKNGVRIEFNGKKLKLSMKVIKAFLEKF